MMIPVRIAEKLAQERGSTFVHPFDDLDIVAGRGKYCNGNCAGASAYYISCASWAAAD